MKIIAIQISVFCMFVIEAAESGSAEGAVKLRREFLLEIGTHYEKMNKGLKTFEPEGTERRDKEDHCIIKAEQQNENMKYYMQTLSVQAIWEMFRSGCSNQGGPLKYVVIHPTEEDVVVFDSLQLPKSFAYYLKIVSQQQ